MDWGFVNVDTDNNTSYKVACFAMICHHCGERYIEFFPNAKQENLFIGMIHAFKRIGVPDHVLTDNMKNFFEVHTKNLTEERLRGNLIEFNGEAEHVHILFELPLSAAPSMVICSPKTQLSREARKRYPEMIRGKLIMEGLFLE